MIATPIRDAACRIAMGIAAASLMTLLAYRFHFNLSSATSAHLFLVVAIALRWGFFEASVVSLFSVACLDYFFTEPLFAFYIADSRDWVALGTFEAGALLVSTLSNQVNRHARESELHQDALKKLYDLSQQILLLDRTAAVEQQLAHRMRSSLQVGGVALWTATGLRMSWSGDCTATAEDVRATYLTGTESDDQKAGTSQRVLRLGTRPVGALHLCGHTLDTATVSAAASLAAIAIERARSFTTEANAEAARQSEQLRSAILDGLAHAFKSPLTTILSSSSGLLAMDTLSGSEKKLVTLIDRHAGHLGDLTTHLLLTARLDRGDLKVKREALDLAQIIRNCVEASSHELEGERIKLRPNACMGSIQADRRLLQMAVVQLLDNALKYGRPGSSVVVMLEQAQSEVHIRVKNEGSFIPAEEREKVFQRFYRCSGTMRTVSGTGIGLAVVRRITEAHHGRTWVESDPVRGTTFVMALPSAVTKE